MATTESCNLSPTWKCPMETLQQGGDGSEKMDLGEDWLILWTCAGGRALCFYLSLCNHREIQMSKAAIPLHIELGGARSQGSALSLAENWSIWIGTKRMRRDAVSSCLFFQMSDRSAGSSSEALSVTKHSLCLPEPLHKHKLLNLLLKKNQTLLPCWRCSLLLLKRFHMSWISHSCF